MRAHERDILTPAPIILKVQLFNLYNIFNYSLPLRELRSQWTISPISLNKTLSLLLNPVLMKKAGTDLLPFQHMLVSTPPIYICIEGRSTTGVDAVTHKTPLGAMDSANGYWQDADLFNSTWRSQVTLRCAIASSQPTHLSAMEHIKWCSDGVTKHTEGSGACGESFHFGVLCPIGCLPSTSDALSSINCAASMSSVWHYYLNFIKRL